MSQYYKLLHCAKNIKSKRIDLMDKPIFLLQII